MAVSVHSSIIHPVPHRDASQKRQWVLMASTEDTGKGQTRNYKRGLAQEKVDSAHQLQEHSSLVEWTAHATMANSVSRNQGFCPSEGHSPRLSNLRCVNVSEMRLQLGGYVGSDHVSVVDSDIKLEARRLR